MRSSAASMTAAILRASSEHSFTAAAVGTSSQIRAISRADMSTRAAAGLL